MHHNATYLESIEISHHTKNYSSWGLGIPGAIWSNLEQSGAIWSNLEHLEPAALEPGASPSSKLATTNSPPSGRPQRRLGEVAGKICWKILDLSMTGSKLSVPVANDQIHQRLTTQRWRFNSHHVAANKRARGPKNRYQLQP